jgi:hypothetical protein
MIGVLPLAYRGVLRVADPASHDAVADSTLASRYELHELLGRGGMARVYRATDLATGSAVALKQLMVPAGTADRALIEALFEREFHTLTQLQHPRVIAVYDYGVVAGSGPFYTMELLDGGDLRDRAPLPWREVCGLLFDVCSSLALLHSRRLIHRDVTPRNVRCTRDGKAKLIDFGALAALGVGGARVVGTPAFISPEALHRQLLDGRADLYSLGATLYYALTGKPPYRAANFTELTRAWMSKVAPPSAYVAKIPSELDHLVLSLINLDPALRPQSAFDVMQRLAAIAGLTSLESEDVSRSYLTTPALVGCEQIRRDIRAWLQRSGAMRSAGLMLSGVTGVGRSRMLDAAVLDAKALGFTVLRATASGAREPFAVALALVQHVLEVLPGSGIERSCPELFASASPVPANDTRPAESLPPRVELKRPEASDLGAAQLQQHICRVLETVSRTHSLVIAVDDVQRVDQASAAVLAALADGARPGKLFLLLTADSSDAMSPAHSVLARRCEQLTLEPLTRAQTYALFESLFGDVANLKMLADEVYSVALGNPRQCLDMAQHLVDRRVIRYSAGTWALPNQLSAGDLPQSAEAAMHARIAFLSPQARFLAESHALAYFDVFARRDYQALLPEASSGSVDRAIAELVAVRALICDGQMYTLANRVWAVAFQAGLDTLEAQRRHRALARLYAEQSTFALIYHLFSSGQYEQGVDTFLRQEAEWDKGFNHTVAQEQNVAKTIWCAGVAADVAVQLGRSRRQAHQLRRWFVAGTATTDSKQFAAAAQPWLEQVKRDSGLERWERDPDTSNPGERLTRALQGAYQCYLDTPEAERVYSVPEALRLLAEYVVLSIAVGSRSYDTALVASLPGLLEPFAALSPALGVIWLNAKAAYLCSCECRYEAAHALWLEVLSKLQTMTDELQHLEPIRGAVTFAVGIMEAQFGLAAAADHAAGLDHDPYQKITALQLRKIVRLEQGDWNGADDLRRQAEVLSLQVRTAPMFKMLLSVEATAYSNARDLAGLQHVIEQQQLMAAEYPGWIPHLRLAEARFHLVRGDYTAAQLGFERCIELSASGAGELSPSMQVWVVAQAGLAETLLCLGHVDEACARASSALAVCDERQMKNHANDLRRVLGLIEGKLGNARGAERLDALIAEQLALGATGLRLGMSYEARAQVAIWSDDRAAFERFSRLTAREYRYGLGCPLGARYERLVHEAQRQGFAGSAQLVDFETVIETALAETHDAQTKVTRILTGAQDSERATRALRLLCAAFRAQAGHLYGVAAEGLSLRASLETLQPSDETCLTQLVQQFLADELDRLGGTDGMATCMPEDLTHVSTIQLASTAYDLVLLSCMQGVQRTIVGVVALSAAQADPDNMERFELIPAVAEQLLAAAHF